MSDKNAAGEKRAKKAYRMFPYFWMEDELFARTRDGLVRDRDVIDEITLFCDHMHMAYMPDEMLAQFAGTVKKRIAELKGLGFPSVGLNMLQTVGHGDFHAALLPAPPMRTAVDWLGNTSATQLCPRSEEFRAFTIKKYKAFAETGPDFIWVDDDFRVPDKSVCFTCFCDDCLAKFNAAHGFRYDRESLVADLSLPGDDPKGQDIRRKWSRFNLDAYVEVMKMIRAAVKGVDERIKLGLMVVHLPAQEYLLCDYTDMNAALGSDMIRPGGGFHSEGNAREIFVKMGGVMGQNAQLADVPLRQYEYEVFPQNYYKSGRMTALEGTAAIMAGCNSIAFASLPPDEGNEREIGSIRAHTELWDYMVRVGDGWKLYGADIPLAKEYGVYSDGHYFTKAYHSFFNVLCSPFAAGFMSMTPYPENSLISLIGEDTANAFSEEELKAMFAKGVIMDGQAAEYLCRRGLGWLCGCRSADYIPDHSAEQYTAHPLNGTAAGTYRYMYTSSAEQTYNSNSAGVPPTKHFLGLFNFELMEGAEPLTVSANVRREFGGTASYVYENSLGGRVAVFGYLPWSYFGTWQRLLQTGNIVDWLSRDKMPVKVLNNQYVVSYIKQPEDRSQFMLMLINAFQDNTSEEVVVRVRGEYHGNFTFCGDDGAMKTLPAFCAKVENGCTTLRIPQIPGWGFCVICSR